MAAAITHAMERIRNLRRNALSQRVCPYAREGLVRPATTLGQRRSWR